MKGGHSCKGYGTLIKPKSTQRSISFINYCSAVRELTPWSSKLPERDQQTLEFFRSRTASQLCGHSKIDRDVWYRCILQAATHEPAIRHAVLAVGSCHRYFEGGHPNIERDKPSGIRHYGRSMSLMLHVGNSPFPVSVALVISVLFTIYESMSGNYALALNHILNGMRILQTRRDVQTASPYVPEPMLRGLLARLHRQAMEMCRSKWWYPLTTVPKLDLRSPFSFTCIDDALAAFEVFVNHCQLTMNAPQYQVGSCGGLSRDHQSEYRSVFLQWSHSLDEWLGVMVASDQIEHGRSNLSLLLLRIHQQMLFITLHRNGSAEGEMSYDSFLPQFESLVFYASEYYQALSMSTLIKNSTTPLSSQMLPDDELSSPFHEGLCTLSLNQHSRSFSLSSLSPIQPLYFAASRCRDPVIRRTAISLLYRLNERNTLWDSTLTAQVCERLVHHEEAAAFPRAVNLSDEELFHTGGSQLQIPRITSASQVPLEVRFKRLIVEFQQGMTVNITFPRNGEDVTEQFTWVS